MSRNGPQVYRRLRGTLFFGPGFAVTKNKLTFCDALDQTLAGAEPGAAIQRHNPPCGRTQPKYPSSSRFCSMNTKQHRERKYVG
jgi:hypothetical protein